MQLAQIRDLSQRPRQRRASPLRQRLERWPGTEGEKRRARSGGGPQALPNPPRRARTTDPRFWRRISPGPSDFDLDGFHSRLVAGAVVANSDGAQGTRLFVRGEASSIGRKMAPISIFRRDCNGSRIERSEAARDRDRTQNEGVPGGNEQTAPTPRQARGERAQAGVRVGDHQSINHTTPLHSCPRFPTQSR